MSGAEFSSRCRFQLKVLVLTLLSRPFVEEFKLHLNLRSWLFWSFSTLNIVDCPGCVAKSTVACSLLKCITPTKGSPIVSCNWAQYSYRYFGTCFITLGWDYSSAMQDECKLSLTRANILLCPNFGLLDAWRRCTKYVSLTKLLQAKNRWNTDL